MKKTISKPRKTKPLNKHGVKRCLRTLKLKEGEKFLRYPDKPIIHINGSGKYCYLWIGNDSGINNYCYATISGQRTLEKFARGLLDALGRK